MISIRNRGLVAASLIAVAALAPSFAQAAGTQDPAQSRREAKATRRQMKAERRNMKAESREMGGSSMGRMQGSMQGGSMSGSSMSMSTVAIGADFQATVDRAIGTLDAINRLIDANTARNNALRAGQPAPN